VPLRQGAPHDQNDPQLNLDVGWLRWSDLLSLRSIRERYFLSQPARRANAGHPVVAGFRQLVPLLRSPDRVFVARSERHPVGYAVFSVLDPDRRWILEGIGANLGVYEAQPVWEELVNFGVVAAGLEGAKRLYAKVPRRSGLVPVFRASGFAPYANEIVLGGSFPVLGGGSTRVRKQQPSDVWAIHQLYMATVPQPVQFAEALTSHHWDVRPRLSAQYVQSGWIIDNGRQLVAYMRAMSRSDSHVLEFNILPDQGDLFPELVDGALGGLATMSPRPVHIQVRGYQQEFVRPLIDRGFALHLEQDLLVKYTTAVARAPYAAVVSFPQEVKDPVGKRVPTFLKGSTGDPASESSA
jgi:hypothetical protein